MAIRYNIKLLQTPMHPAVKALAQSLSFGKAESETSGNKERDTVGSLARAYEIARNALEYRADHLVKRAAIERILRREVMFSNKPETITEELLQELSWARYIHEDEKESDKKTEIENLMKTYLPIFTAGKVNKDWLLGVVSSEIEEIINPNPDYENFTNFTFHVFKKKIDLPNTKNPDLVLLVALDKMYAQSDEARIAFHIYKLIRSQNKNSTELEKTLQEAHQYYIAANKSPALPKMISFVRKQMGPMILLRDMYFSKPENFIKELENEKEFKNTAQTVLGEQLFSLRKKMNTATVRSLIYVFLTKMLLIVILERPAESLLGVKPTWISTAFNIVIPVIIMWLLSYQIKLPKKNEQERIINEAWKQASDFGATVDRREMLTETKKKGSSIFMILFYVFYALLFVGIFALINAGLSKLNFTLVSKAIFMFFLSVVTFFAYRIRQYSLVYTFKPKSSSKSSLMDMLMLPILVVGGWLSKGVSRLNFLVFFFDFILESPFKIILRFLDSWFQFLSAKREEAVG